MRKYTLILLILVTLAYFSPNVKSDGIAGTLPDPPNSEWLERCQPYSPYNYCFAKILGYDVGPNRFYAVHYQIRHYPSEGEKLKVRVNDYIHTNSSLVFGIEASEILVRSRIRLLKMVKS